MKKTFLLILSVLFASFIWTGVQFAASSNSNPKPLTLNTEQYMALCTETQEHDLEEGKEEYGLTAWLDSKDAADEAGKAHEQSTKGHRWTIKTREKPSATPSFFITQARFTPAASFSAGDDCDCNAALIGGTFSYRALKADSSAESEFERYVARTDYEEARSQFKGSVDVKYKLFGGSGDWDKNEYSKKQSSYQEKHRDWQTATSSLELLEKFGDANVLNAWTSCKSSCKIQGIHSWIEKRDENNMTLVIRWIPYDGQRDEPVIANSSISGAIVTDEDVPDGKVVPNQTPIPNGHTRINLKRADKNQPVFISLRISGQDVSEFMPKFIPPPPKPQPVYGMQWFKEDTGGSLFQQTMYHHSPNRHNQGGILGTGQYNLADTAGRIYRVDFRCEKHPEEPQSWCGFNYNPDGGYAGNTTIVDGGKGFIWRRRWDGKPVREYYTAYYELQRNVCVKNCE